MKKILTIIIVLLLTNTLVKGGVFSSATVMSSSGEYNLQFYVPDNYDANKSYSLVLGMAPCNGATAKSYLIGLKPLTDSLNMIVVCPDLSKTGNWMNDLNMDIITTAIDSALSMYSIDEKSVYLNGMSCNGEVTVRKGLNKIYPFKGIIPWAPYISGVDNKGIDLNSDMPITISIGTKDSGLLTNLALYDSLKTHGSAVNLILVEGIDHTFNFTNFGNEMIHSLQYLKDTNSIAINYSESTIPSFEMTDKDAVKELEFNVTNQSGKELTFSAISSNLALIGNPEIVYTAATNTAKLKIQPKVLTGKAKGGKLVIILEAKEKNGAAIEQVVIKFKITRNTTSISALNTGSSLQVYPNPATDQLYLKGEDQNLPVQITDVNGRVVLKTKGSNNTSIDISILDKGMYFLRPIGQCNNNSVKFFVK